LINKSAGLVTTIQEESRPGEERYTLRGAPVVQGLAWLTWGPVGALLAVTLLTILAILFNLPEQRVLLKVLFIAAFFILPALAWAGLTLWVTVRSRKYIQALLAAESQICTIRLCHEPGQLYFTTGAMAAEQAIPYALIRQAKVTYPVGERGGKKTLLTLITENGSITLLNEGLGNPSQKIDLAQKIQQAVDRASGQ
jgi:hypothetical protein